MGNLSFQEIIDQVLHFARILKKQKQTITNIVFMGMGEPLLNFEQVMESIKILNDPKRFGFGIRRIVYVTYFDDGIVNKSTGFLDIPW